MYMVRIVLLTLQQLEWEFLSKRYLASYNKKPAYAGFLFGLFIGVKWPTINNAAK